MYKIYFKEKNGKRINEEPLITEDMPLYGSTFCLSLKEDAVTMRVEDSVRIFGTNDLDNGFSYYLTVAVAPKSISSSTEFTPEQLEIVKRDIKELNANRKPLKI